MLYEDYIIIFTVKTKTKKTFLKINLTALLNSQFKKIDYCKHCHQSFTVVQQWHILQAFYVVNFHRKYIQDF